MWLPKRTSSQACSKNGLFSLKQQEGILGLLHSQVGRDAKVKLYLFALIVCWLYNRVPWPESGKGRGRPVDRTHTYTCTRTQTQTHTPAFHWPLPHLPQAPGCSSLAPDSYLSPKALEQMQVTLCVYVCVWKRVEKQTETLNRCNCYICVIQFSEAVTFCTACLCSEAMRLIKKEKVKMQKVNTDTCTHTHTLEG